MAEEADEAVYWLEFLWSIGLGDPATVERLLAEAKELRAIFAALQNLPPRTSELKKL